MQPVYTCRSWTNAAAQRRPSTVRLQPTALNIGRLRPAGERSAKPVLMPKLRQGLQLLLRIAIGRLREEGPGAQQHNKCAHHNQRRRHSWSAARELSPRSEGGGSGSCAARVRGRLARPFLAGSHARGGPTWRAGAAAPPSSDGVPRATPPHPPCAFALPSKFSCRKISVPVATPLLRASSGAIATPCRSGAALSGQGSAACTTLRRALHPPRCARASRAGMVHCSSPTPAAMLMKAGAAAHR